MIWVNKSSPKDRILIPKVGIVFGLSKKVSSGFGLNAILNVGFDGELLSQSVYCRESRSSQALVVNGVEYFDV